MKNYTFILLLAAAVFCQSCATVLSGGTTFNVKENAPVGAKVYIDDVFQGATPVTFKYKDEFGITRDAKHTLEVRMEGFKTQKIPLKRKIQIGYVVLDVVCAVFPLPIDFITGSIYAYYPRNIKVDLEIENEKTE